MIEMLRQQDCDGDSTRTVRHEDIPNIHQGDAHTAAVPMPALFRSASMMRGSCAGSVSPAALLRKSATGTTRPRPMTAPVCTYGTLVSPCGPKHHG